MSHVIKLNYSINILYIIFPFKITYRSLQKIENAFTKPKNESNKTSRKKDVSYTITIYKYHLYLGEQSPEIKKVIEKPVSFHLNRNITKEKIYYKKYSLNKI